MYSADLQYLFPSQSHGFRVTVLGQIIQQVLIAYNMLLKLRGVKVLSVFIKIFVIEGPVCDLCL